jgi:hypothetical protein
VDILPNCFHDACRDPARKGDAFVRERNATGSGQRPLR